MSDQPLCELVDFLRQRLDEDELVAQAAARLQDDPENGWGVARSDSYAESEKRRWISPHIGMVYEVESAVHITRHDPARVLADVARLRQVIAVCEAAIKAGEIQPGTTWNDDAAGAEVAQQILEIFAIADEDVAARG